ncbi:MAG: HAMP domain-containing protein [Planctomycetes bacterium]|nr:HAMP domain-containing protein [Planctomycetota bacterium]
MVIFGVIGYLYSVKWNKTKAIDSIIAVCDQKTLELEVFFRHKEESIRLISQNPLIINFLEHNKEYSVETGWSVRALDLFEENLRQYFMYFTSGRKKIHNLFLINTEGDIIFTIVKEEDNGTNLITGPFRDTLLAKIFKQSLTLSPTDLYEFEYYPPSNSMATFIGVPIWQKEKVSAVLCIQISLDGVLEIISDFSNLGKSGETMAVINKGDRLEIVTPLRHDPRDEFHNTISADSGCAKPIKLAAVGFDGMGCSIDYRGKHTFAVWRYLHAAGWGVVVKMDSDEIFAPTHKFQQIMIYVGISVMVIVVCTTVFVSKKITRPIIRLKDAAKLISAGSLSHTKEFKAGDEIGELARSFNIMVDNLQAVNDKLLTRTDELEASNRELEEFAYIASHDLKEPLRGIHNYSSFLVDDYTDKLDQDGKNKLLTLVKLSRRLEKLIDDLLHFSRVGKVKESFMETDLNLIVDEVLASLKIRLEEEGVEVRRNRDMPVIVCDRVRMKDIYFNLITNAIKYNDKVGKWVEIGCDEVGDAGNHLFYVRDNGIGIREKHIGLVFNIFKRLHRRDKFGGGTGAGLTIVKKILRMSGGKIWVKSVFGHGTTFYFTLGECCNAKNI